MVISNKYGRIKNEKVSVCFRVYMFACVCMCACVFACSQTLTGSVLETLIWCPLPYFFREKFLDKLEETPKPYQGNFKGRWTVMIGCNYVICEGKGREGG